MKLVIFGLILCAIAIVAVVRKRMKRSSAASNTSGSPVGRLEVTAPAAPATRITVMPGQLSPEHMADDGDDEPYWRRYYS